MLKKILITKRLSKNWIYIVKKIIIYSHNKAVDINNLRNLNKNTKNKIEKTRSLHFLNNYTDYYIEKYLNFDEKGDTINVKLK